MHALKRPVALSGPMGVGKTTVGRRVAELTGAPFIDVDDEIAGELGRSVAEVFRTDGEAAFRARERATIARLLRKGPAVLALGGGVVVDEGTRRSLLQRAVVVTLDAPVEELVQRLGPEQVAKRPLLVGSEPTERLRALIDDRRVPYAEAHVRIATRGRSVSDVASEVCAVWARDPVVVPLGERTYRVEVGRGVRRELTHVLKELGGEVLVVSDDKVWPAVEDRFRNTLVRVAGSIVLPSGETHKTLDSVRQIWDAALEAGLDRRGVILAIGGGVVGDLAGFAAATLLRGVRFVQVPTTLLAMVDASVGGKTAIDRPQGKNLVGAFHQPSAVIADVDLLNTLPERELRSGFAEVIKTALIGDPELLAGLEKGDTDLVSIVRASIACKARVVSEDERDVTGARAALNFGHTLGHALEAEGGYARYTHGEAVALGMVAALRIGVARKITKPELLARTTALLQKHNLPYDLDSSPLAAALPRIVSDKKREGDKIAFVLLDDIARPRNERLSLEQVSAALLG
jgi:shikimate kinase / 3-dehydroquinate synthase